LFDQPAIDAVTQWRKEATTLDGKAVPVIMTVTVNFCGERSFSATVLARPSATAPNTSPSHAYLRGDRGVQDHA
jgi:hypothetical protein